MNDVEPYLFAGPFCHVVRRLIVDSLRGFGIATNEKWQKERTEGNMQ